MPTGQMNVRIDDATRIEGNAAFESIGWSPSQAAREMWGYAARNRRDRRKLRELRSILEGGKDGNSKALKLAEGSRIVSEGLAGMGIGIAECDSGELSYDELREQALRERLGERGLL